MALPTAIQNSFHSELKIIQEQLGWVNLFWPKNDSRTNTERHTYFPVISKFENYKVSAEIHRRILKSFAPDWDHRFSFYKDNGWIYICRSSFIICRFKFRYDKGEFMIVDIQVTGSEKHVDDIFHELLSSVKQEWALLTNLFKYYSYYGEIDSCPQVFRGTLAEKFWEGEKMFYDTQMDNLGKWIQEGKQSVEKSENSSFLMLAKKIGPESFGVVFYINTLYAKWCPMDNLDWIFEY